MPEDDVGTVARLFSREVPEIAAGIVQIKAIARKPGYRCKFAVQGNDPGVDGITACIGVGGFRIKNVVDALRGERVDLVRWVDSPEQLIANSLQPAEIERVILKPAEHCAVVVVQPDQVSLALGHRGVNRQLAIDLTGWQIEVEVLQV